MTEYAALSRRKLKNPAVGNMSPDALRRQGIDPDSLLEESEEDQQRRLATWRLENYWPKFTPEQLQQEPYRSLFMKDNELAGRPVPTRQVSGTTPLTLGGAGSPIEAVREQAGKTVQIPTGQYVETPVFPQAPVAPPERFVVLDKATGKVTIIEAPPGTRGLTVTSSPPEPQAIPVYTVDAKGRPVQTGWMLPGGRVVTPPKPGGGDGTGGVGAEIPTGGALPQGQVVRVYPIYKKGTKILTAYGIQMQNGQVVQYTRQQAEAEVKRMIGVGDGRWAPIAKGIGLSPKVTDQWKFEAKGDAGRKKEIGALQDNLRQIETDMLVAGNAIKAAKSLQDVRKAEADLRALTIRRAQILKRLAVLGGQPVRGVGAPPVGQDDLSDLYK